MLAEFARCSIGVPEQRTKHHGIFDCVGVACRRGGVRARDSNVYLAMHLRWTFATTGSNDDLERVRFPSSILRARLMVTSSSGVALRGERVRFANAPSALNPSLESPAVASQLLRRRRGRLS